MNYADALNSLRPDCAWSWDKKDYSGINWHESNTSPIPSKEELDAEVSRLNAEHVATQYQRDRAEAYASIADQLDMQYWDSVNGTTTWADHIAAVKAAHPKP
jgi:hypothetical protein